MAVLEGDMTTQLDADRLEAVGITVVPITTGCALSGEGLSSWHAWLRHQLHIERVHGLHQSVSLWLRLWLAEKAREMIHVNQQIAAWAKSLIVLSVAGALTLVFEGYLPSAAIAFNPKDLERVLKGQDCPGCDLSGADLFARNLPNINLGGANLSRAKLSLANLKGANLSKADLRSVELWGSFLFGANLSQANLTQSVLGDAYLHQVNLEEAILVRADLSRSYFFDANLKSADLKGAKLDGTNLSGSNLELSNLQQAHFQDTIYDSTTRFPCGFEIARASLTTLQPKSDTNEPPDRGNSRLAEIHQLSLARLFLTMAVADASSYGGSQDRALEKASADMNERLVTLKRETHGENSLENAGELLNEAFMNKVKGNYLEAERLYATALRILEGMKEPPSDLAAIQMEVAEMYKLQNRLGEAESMLQRAVKNLSSPKSKSTEDDETIAALAYGSLSSLIEIYILNKKFSEAELSLQRLQNLTSDTRVDLKKHILLRKAWLKHAQGNVAEAEHLYRLIIDYYKANLQEEFSDVVQSAKVNLQRLKPLRPPQIEKN